MESALRIENKAQESVESPSSPVLASGLNAKGRFKVEHIRDGKVIGEYEFPNGIVDVGLNKLLGVMFNGVTPITTWYLGLIDNAGFSALAAGDTMSSHSGWTEATGYTGDRKEWTEGAAAARAITNSSTVDFAMTGTAVIKGVFLNSDATGTSGTLWATAAFASTVSVVNGDTLKVTYTVSG